ncbi:desulfoferrodoxin family protein [Anaeromicropila populeti]|uniref:Superoxide reductase n=1 Tax=Anaeromicropila populeti TaxID=37658 RepID=A0A1I6I6X6_9FIRM|nr:desulfoferrodoxin family protein [Anaeromicropila populeti]SFR62140.1 superoxide reductase [Anaeromicropila populeti]
MCKDQRFFICKHCGNIIGMIEDSGVPVVCCGEKMTELVPNTTDGAVEKHVPVVTVEGNKVTVVIGSAEHPMLPEHHISWIYLKTNKGGQRKCLEPGEKPEAVFMLSEGEEAVEVFEYCNIHGLWKKDVE